MRISDWSSDVCSSDLATLKESAGRMNDLLARLSQHHSGGNRAEAPAATDILPLTERVAATRRAQHPIVTTGPHDAIAARSEEHTSELQSLMRTSYAVFCFKKQKKHLSSSYALLHIPKLTFTL